jgi:hypothetical protein
MSYLPNYHPLEQGQDAAHAHAQCSAKLAQLETAVKRLYEVMGLENSFDVRSVTSVRVV